MMGKYTIYINFKLTGPILGSVEVKMCKFAQDGLKLRENHLEIFIVDVGPFVDPLGPP